MKIKISKAQWRFIGKTAGWVYNFCAYCGNPIEKPQGTRDDFCEDKKCKIHDPSTPDSHIEISDGICPDCLNKEVYLKNKENFPYYQNKDKTPKDLLMQNIGHKQPSEEEIQKIFQKK